MLFRKIFSNKKQMFAEHVIGISILSYVTPTSLGCPFSLKKKICAKKFAYCLIHVDTQMWFIAT